MRVAPLALSVVLTSLVACGGDPPSPKAPETPATKASTASSSTPAPAESSGPCVASLAKAKPDGWIEVGKLVITVKDEMPTGYELFDAQGKKVDAGPIDKKGARGAGNEVAQKICKIDGVMAVYEGKAEPTTGSMTAIVVKPAKEDEPGDLAMMCKPLPDEMKQNLDELQQRRIAVSYYEEHLSSKKWRGWIHDWSVKLRKSDEAGRPALIKAQAEELAAASKDKKDCWFVAALRK